MKSRIFLLLMIIVSATIVKAQSNSQSQLQIGFHYVVDNKYPIFYRNAHPARKKDTSIANHSLQVFVQYDSAKIEKGVIPLDARFWYEEGLLN